MMNLEEPAASVARELQAKWPVVFTSARRSIQEQAHAMATDIVQSGRGAGWISQTYAQSFARGACIGAVCDLTTPLTITSVSMALQSVLEAMSSEELSHLSRHLGGLAFDIRSDIGAPWWPECMVWLSDECRAHGGKLLTHEGGLVRTHAEFSPAPEAVVA